MQKKRKLFCEISPFTYKISVLKQQFIRYLKWIFLAKGFSKEFSEKPLPVLIYKHKSLIRRTLGNVDMQLQENKAVNLKIASQKLNGIIIKPHETFSFWWLVRSCTAGKGYKEGLVIANDRTAKGYGGGMCQMTNLIHWMILHTPLTIVEHHHHNRFDLFPDFNRQVPFGTGTSIMYNYLDYQFCNNSDNTYQLILYVTDKYLCGELRAMKELEHSYHIYEKNMHYNCKDGVYYRNNEIHRETLSRATGNAVKNELIISNHSQVMYDISHIKSELIREA